MTEIEQDLLPGDVDCILAEIEKVEKISWANTPSAEYNDLIKYWNADSSEMILPDKDEYIARYRMEFWGTQVLNPKRSYMIVSNP